MTGRRSVCIDTLGIETIALRIPNDEMQLLMRAVPGRRHADGRVSCLVRFHGQGLSTGHAATR